MNLDKNKRLEAHGWKVGSAEEFLDLSDEEKVMLDKVAKHNYLLEKPNTKITDIEKLPEIKNE